MSSKFFGAIRLTLAAAILFGHILFADSIRAQPLSPIILTGKVTSLAEGVMEGVAVIAQREGSMVLTAVMTDAQGRYAFPRNRMEPGQYTVTIRAAGYELPAIEKVSIAAGAQKPVRLDLKLDMVTDASRLASQLTNLEWLNSIPGTPQQRDMLMRTAVPCGFCHTLERVMRSTHTADEFLSVIQRMMTYDSDHASADRPQVTMPPQPVEGLVYGVYGGFEAKRLAEYLASINLSGGRKTWTYPLQTMPRPKGKATRAIVTVYPIPRQPSVIHDLDVDSKGNVWYGNSGWDYIGKLDPRSGTFSEWEAPNYLPATQFGLPRRLGVQDIQVDSNDDVWAAVGGTRMARFNVKTETWSTFDLPISPAVSPFFISPFRDGDHTVWTTGHTQNPDGTLSGQKAFRLHVTTGKVDGGYPLFDGLPPPQDPVRLGAEHYCYMMDRDANDNFIGTDAFGSNIVRVDANTGKATLYPTPTPWAFPRRGYTDDQNRFWFGEFYADNIGVFDADQKTIREFPVSTQYIAPYYARPDKQGNIWVSSNGSDRLIRLNPKTGEVLLYLMPVYYDARKVVVDPSTKMTTIWLPNKNTGQLIRVEALD
ncbi:MAG: carboxypeptidase regulatory-like domain-containing protein [Steroidobacteraceae bacterium]